MTAVKSQEQRHRVGECWRAALTLVLQFVSQSDNIQSCKFAQTMEQRLQKAFQDAEKKVLSTKSNLTVQVRTRALEPCHWQRPIIMQMWARDDSVPDFQAAWGEHYFGLWAHDVGRTQCLSLWPLSGVRLALVRVSGVWKPCRCLPAVVWDFILIFPCEGSSGLSNTLITFKKGTRIYCIKYIKCLIK